MSHRKKLTLGAILARSLFPAVFLLAGGIFLVVSFGHFKQARQSAEWPTTTATIEKSEFIVPRAATATFRVVYGYTVSGRALRGNRVDA